MKIYLDIFVFVITDYKLISNYHIEQYANFYARKM